MGRLLVAVASLVAERQPQGMQALVARAPRLESTGSGAVGGPLAYCPGACGILMDQGLNLCLLPWQAVYLLLSHQGSPEHFPFFFF